MRADIPVANLQSDAVALGGAVTLQFAPLAERAPPVMTASAFSSSPHTVTAPTNMAPLPERWTTNS